MNSDQTFRIVLIVGALMLLPIMAYHRLKSQATCETLARWQEGRLIVFTLRPVGILGILGLIAFMINPSWMAWSSVAAANWFLFLSGALWFVLIIVRMLLPSTGNEMTWRLTCRWSCRALAALRPCHAVRRGAKKVRVVLCCEFLAILDRFRALECHADAQDSA